MTIFMKLQVLGDIYTFFLFFQIAVGNWVSTHQKSFPEFSIQYFWCILYMQGSTDIAEHDSVIDS